MFPYILVRLPIVPRSALGALAWRRTLAWLQTREGGSASLRRAYLEDERANTPATIRLLQDPSFLEALIQANPELGRRVAMLDAASDRLFKKERQTIRAALRYWWRGALRPSPFGGLCGTALGTIEEYWPNPVPNLSVRSWTRNLAPSFVSFVAKMAWRSSAARRHSRLYASPLIWDGPGPRKRFWNAAQDAPVDVPGSLTKLLHSLEREPAQTWGTVAAVFGESLIAEAVRAGVVEQFAAAPVQDEGEALTQILWQASFEDVALLGLLGTLSTDAAGPTACENSIKSDTCYPVRLGLAGVPRLRDFLQEIADFGARIAQPVSTESRLAGQILRRFASAGQPIALLAFFAHCKDLAAASGIEFRTPEDWAPLAAALGIVVEPPESPIRGWMLRSVGSGAVEFPLPGSWVRDNAVPLRVSFRFRRGRSDRFLLTHFGGDRMSLLPRYKNLSFDDRNHYRHELKKWMNRWPQVHQLYGGTVHDADSHRPPEGPMIHFPGASPPPGSSPLGSIMISLRPEDDVPVLTDSTGSPIQPAFFGVSAERLLPPILRLTLSVRNSGMTVLEGVYYALRAEFADAFDHLADMPIELPAVTLGQTILLSPRLWLIPCSILPHIHTPIDAEGFLHFQDWLSRWRLPSGIVQVAQPGQEAQWVDLRNPEGVNNFLRVCRPVDAVIVGESLLENDEEGLESICGWFEPEYYAEVRGSGMT